MTTINDIVLIYFEDKPLVFARVEAITPDVKAGWYGLKLLLLQMPLQAVTWILRDAYINGGEFTMNGKRMRLEKVVAPAEPDETGKPAVKEEAPKKKTEGKEGGKVISLADLKKK
ncbi:MAG: hypothetical protein AB1427_21085 [Thermodesulfobacteriota bacterium]